MTIAGGYAASVTGESNLIHIYQSYISVMQELIGEIPIACMIRYLKTPGYPGPL